MDTGSHVSIHVYILGRTVHDMILLSWYTFYCGLPRNGYEMRQIGYSKVV